MKNISQNKMLWHFSMNHELNVDKDYSKKVRKLFSLCFIPKDNVFAIKKENEVENEHVARTIPETFE